MPKIEVAIAGEVAASAALRKNELAFLKKRQRGLRQFTTVILPVLSVAMIAVLASMGPMQALVMTVCTVVLLGIPGAAILLVLQRDLRNRMQALEQRPGAG